MMRMWYDVIVTTWPGMTWLRWGSLPSGYLTVCYGKSAFLSSVNHLFLWAMASMAMLVITRGYVIFRRKKQQCPLFCTSINHHFFTHWLFHDCSEIRLDLAMCGVNFKIFQLFLREEWIRMAGKSTFDRPRSRIDGFLIFNPFQS